MADQSSQISRTMINRRAIAPPPMYIGSPFPIDRHARSDRCPIPASDDTKRATAPSAPLLCGIREAVFVHRLRAEHHILEEKGGQNALVLRVAPRVDRDRRWLDAFEVPAHPVAGRPRCGVVRSVRAHDLIVPAPIAAGTVLGPREHGSGSLAADRPALRPRKGAPGRTWPFRPRLVW